jgi:hypothetical protein
MENWLRDFRSKWQYFDGPGGHTAGADAHHRPPACFRGVLGVLRGERQSPHCLAWEESCLAKCDEERERSAHSPMAGPR